MELQVYFKKDAKVSALLSSLLNIPKALRLLLLAKPQDKQYFKKHISAQILLTFSIFFVY